MGSVSGLGFILVCLFWVLGLSFFVLGCVVVFFLIVLVMSFLF